VVTNRKCGFPTVLQAYASENPEMQKKLYPDAVRKMDYDSVYYSPSGHFKIFYNMQGYNSIPDYDRNGNGTPDYLEFVANSFDRAWRIEIDSLGFLPPPDSTGNARNIYPVYCRRLSTYGVTYLDYEIPQLPDMNFVTSIEINIDFSFVNYPQTTDPIVRDSMAIAVTAAHEFNHALQSGYRLWPDGNGFFHDLWFIESSATFMEEVVASQVNDYLYYLDDYFNRARYPFDESTGFLSDYGKVVLEIMLGITYEEKLVRLVWENIRNRRALSALETVLQSYQTDFSQEFEILALWLYFIRERSVPFQYFPDAALFPEINFRAGESIGVNSSVLISDSLPERSFQWYLSEATLSRNIQLKFEAGSSFTSESVSAVAVNSLNGEYYSIPVNRVIDLPFIAQSPEFPYLVTNRDTLSSRSLAFEIKGKLKSVPSVANAVVYPQPFKISEQESLLKFGNIEKGTTISIFNSNGQFVRQLICLDESAIVSWNLRNSQGEMVGSGVYLYQVEKDDEKKNGKFVLIK
jgi:hypothetical protein